MNFDRILRFVLVTGIFIVPFIPFIVANSMFFPFITGKNFFFRILVEILFATWLLLAIRNPSYRPTFSWIALSIGAFIGIIALADIFGANPLKSIWSNFERMEGLVTLIHLGAYFLVAGTVLNSQKLWTAFFHTSVGASVLMSVFGLFQFAGVITINQSDIRVDARFGNATYMAIYMVFHIFITLFLLARWRGGMFARYLYGAIILLHGFILYHTATRGAILGLIGGIVLAAILVALFEREKKWLRKIAVGVLVASALLVGGFISIKDAQFIKDSRVLSRFANIEISEGNVESRFLIWDMALQGFKERPLLGWGQENFNLVFNTYYNPALYSDEPWFDRVHNIVLDWLIAGGILGLLAYISIPLALLYYLWFGRSEKLSIIDKSLLTGLLAAYGFHNLFVFDNLVSYILFFSILAYVYSLTRPEINEKGKWGQYLDDAWTDRVAFPVILIALVLTIYAVNTKPILATTTLLDALRPNQQGVEGNIQIFQEALAYDTFGTQEIREQIAQGASQVSNQNIDPVIKQQFFDLAKTELEKQIADASLDARHELFIGTLLDAYGRYPEAGEHYTRAHELSPDKQSIRFALGFNLLNRNENEPALELFKETVDLEPRFRDAHIFYAVALIYSNQFDAADQVLLEKFETTTLSNDRLLRAYFDSGQYNKARGLLTARLEQNPNNRDVQLQIAFTYIQEGNTGEAIRIVEEVIALHPDFKDQGESIINEIQAGRTP